MRCVRIAAWLPLASLQLRCRRVQSRHHRALTTSMHQRLSRSACPSQAWGQRTPSAPTAHTSLSIQCSRLDQPRVSLEPLSRCTRALVRRGRHLATHRGPENCVHRRPRQAPGPRGNRGKGCCPQRWAAGRREGTPSPADHSRVSTVEPHADSAQSAHCATIGALYASNSGTCFSSGRLESARRRTLPPAAAGPGRCRIGRITRPQSHCRCDIGSQSWRRALPRSSTRCAGCRPLDVSSTPPYVLRTGASRSTYGAAPVAAAAAGREPG